MDIMSSIHPLGASKRFSSNIGPILQRFKSFKQIGTVFDMKLIQNSEKRVFKSGMPQKSSTVDIMSWILSLGSSKRFRNDIGLIFLRCISFEKLGNVFDMKLIQNSEKRVFKSGMPQKLSTVDIMSWILSLGSSKRIRSDIGLIFLRCMSFEKLVNVFDMKLIQDSEIRVFKSGIPKKSSTVDIMSWINY